MHFTLSSGISKCLIYNGSIEYIYSFTRGGRSPIRASSSSTLYNRRVEARRIEEAVRFSFLLIISSQVVNTLIGIEISRSFDN
jgi:hypothetical protein